MLTYRLVNNEQYDEILQLLAEEAAEYLLRTLQLMHLTLEQLKDLVRTTGQVYGIYQHDVLAGFYWIEERGNVLHLHGLVLKGVFQGKGIGTRVLDMLAARYSKQMEVIELGVHESNARAMNLYERLGYRTVRRLDDLGFHVMQQPLAEQPSVESVGRDRE